MNGSYDQAGSTAKELREKRRQAAQAAEAQEQERREAVKQPSEGQPQVTPPQTRA